MGEKFVINPAEIRTLAPMPAAVGQLAQVIAKPDADVAEVVHVIEFDQALTANVLRWGNSAWSGASSRIVTIREAVMRLGMATILKLAVGQGIAAAAKASPGLLKADEEPQWRHSITAALAAETLSGFICQAVPHVAFTAALIHDIGKLLMRRKLAPETLEEINRLVVSEGLRNYEAEERILGTTHARVGGEIAWFWKFPEELARAIEHHHDPNPAPDLLVDSVQVADAVANYVAEKSPGEDRATRVNAKVLKRLDLTPQKVQILVSTVKEKLDEALALWDL